MTPGLAVLGGGRMGEALVKGLLAAGRGPEGLTVVEASASRREELGAAHPELDVSSSVPRSVAAVIAVKPADAEGACRAAGAAGAPRVLSIAAGVTLRQLASWLPAGTPVLRAMPNTPAVVGAAASAVAAGPAAGSDDLEWAVGLLAAVGSVVAVPEGQLDAVTGLSGSGPAYVFLLAEALVEGGVLAGLPRAVASELAVQTVLGAGRLLAESGDSPAELRAAVTSPGGTTAAGLRALESGGVRSAVLEAVMAATERSRQLGG